MRTVNSVMNVVFDVAGNDIIEEKYLSLRKLSEYLRSLEISDAGKYYGVRKKLYNAIQAGKINTVTKAGIRLIDIENPMRGVYSIKLTFRRVG